MNVARVSDADQSRGWGGFKYPCEDGEVLLFVGWPRPRVALTHFGRVSEESGRCHELSERRFIAFAPVWQT